MATRHLALASYNVHACVGRDGREDPLRIARVLHELDCPVIGLQEVHTRGGAGHPSMQLDLLAEATGMTPVPGLTIVRQDGHYGNALLTRFPVREVRRHDLAVVRFEPRGALEVEIEVEIEAELPAEPAMRTMSAGAQEANVGRRNEVPGHAGGARLRVVVAHFGLRPAERRMQVLRLLRGLGDPDDPRPLVLLGDMNEWLPTGRPLRWLHARFGETPAQATFPALRPVFALDRVWVQPRASLHRLTVHRSPLARIASDHLPVRVEIALDGFCARRGGPVSPSR